MLRYTENTTPTGKQGWLNKNPDKFLNHSLDNLKRETYKIRKMEAKKINKQSMMSKMMVKGRSQSHKDERPQFLKQPENPLEKTKKGKNSFYTYT